MNRNDKIKKIYKLEQLIEKQNDIIIKERSRLRELENELEQENRSELPILLFTICRKINNCNTFLNIYYYVDLDKIDEITQYNQNSYLRKTIDLRNVYRKEENDISKYEIENAIGDLKDIINSLFNSCKISSWSDLGLLLNNYNFSKTKIYIRNK